jgi:hypothetical protein
MKKELSIVSAAKATVELAAAQAERLDLRAQEA